VLLESLPDAIRRKQRRAAGKRMRERGLRCSKELLFRGHVQDRVVDEHHVEGSTEAQRSHVSDVVLALRIELAAEAQHLFGRVRQRAAKAALEVKRVVARAGAQLEQRLRPKRGCALQNLGTPYANRPGTGLA
jgi:hypothetical protein